MPEPDEEGDGACVGDPGDEEGRPDAEAERDRVQALAPVDLEVHRRVDDVEAADPERDGAAEQERLPVDGAGHRDPAADRREPVDRPQERMAEPGEPLEIRVDDEAGNRDRPEDVRHRRELPHGDEEHGERRGGERPDLDRREQPGRELAAGGARVSGVDPRVDQPVERHRQAARADHRHGDPREELRGGHLAGGEDRAGVGVGQGEDGVLELDERDEPAGVDGGRGQCAVGRSSRSRRPWSSAGATASKSSAHARGLPGSSR